MLSVLEMMYNSKKSRSGSSSRHTQSVLPVAFLDELTQERKRCFTQPLCINHDSEAWAFSDGAARLVRCLCALILLLLDRQANMKIWDVVFIVIMYDTRYLTATLDSCFLILPPLGALVGITPDFVSRDTYI